MQVNVFFRGCLGVVRYLYGTQIHPLWVTASFSNGEFDGLILMFHRQEKIFSQCGKGTVTWNSSIGKRKKKRVALKTCTLYTQQTYFNRCSVFKYEN